MSPLFFTCAFRHHSSINDSDSDFDDELDGLIVAVDSYV
jgi:hypothetical protein